MTARPQLCLMFVSRIVAMSLVSAAAQAQVTNLGTFTAYGVSGNGQVVVGSAPGVIATYRAVRWTATTGIQPLAEQFQNQGSQALAVSADGSTIVGYVSAAAARWRSESGSWSSGGTVLVLGSLTNATYSNAYAANADGSIVVGGSGATGPFSFQHAVRWTVVGGSSSIQDLGSLTGSNYSVAYGVSADGSLVVGDSDASVPPITQRHAFRWTGATGMQSLDPITGQLGPNSHATAASHTGALIAGYANFNPNTQAFRWTDPAAGGTGMQSLGAVPGHPTEYVYAYAIRADGSAVVGRYGSLASGYRAFLWTSTFGIVDLNGYLPAHGVTLTGWVLDEARGISDNGRIIVGNGRFQGSGAAWALSVPCLLEDADGNGAVDPSDVARFVSNWFASLGGGSPLGDFDGNGVIQPADIAGFVQAWFAALSNGC